MRLASSIFFTFTLLRAAIAEVPEVESFRPVQQFPDPAPGATLTLGDADSGNGRLVLWDGNAVYRQQFENSELGPLFENQGEGYAGDPSFVALRSNNRTAILGSGVEGLLYRVQDVSEAQDFVPGTEIVVPTFVAGTLLDDDLVALDRVRDDLVGAEIMLVDLSQTPPVARVVLQKPAASAPAALSTDRSGENLFVMDATTRELRSFNAAALVDAFTKTNQLNWTDGAPVGAIGQFLNGGVVGETDDRELVIGGDEGAIGTGGIQWVDHTAIPPTILATLDPAGDGPPFVLIYSRDNDEVIAIDPSEAPPIAYASTEAIPAIPPDSPCSVFDEIDTEFEAFLAAFSPGATDLDGDTIADSAMLELVELFSCRDNETDALGFSTNTAFDDNSETFALEAVAASLSEYSQVIPVLLFLNQSMQAAVLNLLSGAGTPLAGSYASVSCTDIENCLPLFVEDPFTPSARGVSEPYFASGDPDDDGLTNLEEYENVQDMGGDDLDFAVAAASDRLDGTDQGDRGGGGGGCFIATAAFGTPLAAELDSLRAFRDRSLLESAAGAAFVDGYYRVSPSAAAWIAERPALRATVRAAINQARRSGGVAVAFAAAAVGALAMGALRRNAGAVQRK